MTGRNQTAMFLIVWVALAIAWDIRVMWRYGVDATISKILHDWSCNNPILAFALGILVSGWQAGGRGFRFPHHEDERAQSEAFTGLSPFARVWVHGQHLLADGLKMAKSTGNAYTLSDLLNLEFEPLAFRYLCLTAHYRARLNFTFTSLRAAQTGLRRLRQQAARWGEPAPEFSAEAEACRMRFWGLACDDLALPRCLALAWSLARGELRALPNEQKAALARDFDRLLGLELGLPPPRRCHSRHVPTATPMTRINPMSLPSPVSRIACVS